MATGGGAAGYGWWFKTSKICRSTKSGRTDGGWGWKDGGRVGFKKGGLATMFKLKG